MIITNAKRFAFGFVLSMPSIFLRAIKISSIEALAVLFTWDHMLWHLDRYNFTTSANFPLR